MSEPTAATPRPAGQVLLALIVGQLGLHAAMSGLRMASTLQTLREGYSPWAVGLLLALFAAAPVVMALHAGRLADRLGYHRPVHWAAALVGGGMLLALGSTLLGGWPHFALLCAAASLTGAGTNMGMIVIQRTAGLSVGSATQRVRVFSWLGVAPSLSNVLGSVSAGFLIDAHGFTAAYLVLSCLPLVTLMSARAVPALVPRPGWVHGPKRRAWDLLSVPGMKRLLVINWLLSMCWDVHSFAVPILGHERGFSASTIGLILSAFTLTVSLVRLLIPFVAQRMQPAPVIAGAMLGTAGVFALYPLAGQAWQMVGCAMLLGLTLGCTQPMIMSRLHDITPDGRHGESLAFRSMALNAASTVMPLVFGAAGAVVGAGALFWAVGSVVGAGVWLVRRGVASA
jgi:MFS family permease